MSPGGGAAAGVRLILWCPGLQPPNEPDPAELAGRYGAETVLLDWKERLVCSQCGSRKVDMVVSGTKRR